MKVQSIAMWAGALDPEKRVTGWQPPFEHAPPWQLWPHAPQFTGSPARSTSHPSPASRSQSANGAVQRSPHPPSTQNGALLGPEGHAARSQPYAPPSERALSVTEESASGRPPVSPSVRLQATATTTVPS